MTEANSIDRDWERKSDAGDTGEPLSSASPIVWSVNVRDHEVVDMTHAELLARVREGRVPVTAFIWRDGMEEWQALERFPEFEALVKEARSGDSGLRAIPDEEAPTSDNVGGAPTLRRPGTRPIQQTIPGLDAGPAPAVELRGDKSDGDDETTAVFGVLAVYERPFATLEFAPNAVLEAADEKQANDSLTPTNPTPLRRRQGPPLPSQAQRADRTPRKGLRAPALPPLPPRPEPRAAARPEKEAEPLRADEVTAAAPPVVPAASNGEVTPALGVRAASVAPPKVTPAAETPPTAASVAPPPAASVSSPPAANVSPPTAAVSAPRPAIASLPPIIVREADASELVAPPAPVRHDEATLVLARRRTHRWVPLRAAIVSAFGAACLASVLTWAIVRPARAPRAPEPLAEAHAATVDTLAPAPLPEAEPAGTSAPAAEEPAATSAPATGGEEKAAVADQAAARSARKQAADTRRSEPSAGTPAKTATASRRDDSGLDDEPKSAAKPAESVANARPSTAGDTWRSNPGF